MTEKQFEYKLRDYDGVPITDDYTLWKRPFTVSDDRVNGVNVRFKTLSEALNFVLDDGRRIIDIIETWSDMPDLVLDGNTVWHIK